MMGVSPSNVKLLMKNEISLEVVMKERLQEILERDLVKETITRKQVNLHLMISLVYGYFLNAIVAFTVGDFFLTYTRVKDPAELNLQRPAAFTWGYLLVPSVAVIVIMILAILCSVAIYCEASLKWQVMIFHISALITTPLIIELFRMYSDVKGAKEAGYKVLTYFTGKQIAVFWLLIILYVSVLYLISRKWDKMFTKRRYIFPLAGGFTILFSGIAFVTTEKFVIPFVMFVFMTLFIGISWTKTIRDRGIFNRYYAVLAAAKMMNIIGTIHSKRGGKSASFH